MKTTRTVTTPHRSLRFAGAIPTLGIVLGCLLGANAFAAEATKAKTPLAITLTAQKVAKQADGKEKLLAANHALPGELIQYDALYHNQGARALNNVAPTLPIPAGMVYLADSASPAPAEASLDGKNFERIPIKRKVTTPSGETKEQEVAATEYRALRWQVGEMAPGAKTVIVARTRIASASP